MLDEKNIKKGALNVVKTLQGKGFKAYLVGGCVRDLMLGTVPEEWDITTDAQPQEVTKLFKKVIPTGIEFGTVMVILEDGNYEVTTFRSDERYVDGRHPSKVIFTKDLKKDLSRRDFTVNAMAYDPFTKELVDEYNGRKDVKKKVIKAVGDPVERFSEDGLRPVRACRFAARLEFEIEKKTFEAISKTLEVVKKVAPERIHDELVKMLKAKKPSVGFELMRQAGLLKLFMPELEMAYGIEQPKAFHKYDVYWHSLYSCDEADPSNLIVRLAALLHDISKPECKEGHHFYGHDQTGAKVAEKILKRLRFSNDDIKKVKNLIKNHMFNYESSWTDSAVRRFMRRVGVLNLEDLFALRLADTRAMEREINDAYLKEIRNRIQKVIEEEQALHIKDLRVDGKDVMQVLKIKPGPQVGKVLDQLLEKVLDDPALNEREKLLEMIKEQNA